VSEITPTRSVLIELREERRAMREGYAFLDEKCLLLAAEIVRELSRYDEARKAFDDAWQTALAAVAAAVGRHGLRDLAVYEPLDLSPATLAIRRRPLLGITLLSAKLEALPSTGPPAVLTTPEGDARRRAFAQVVQVGAPCAAILGNLERLYHEYRRSIRRTRALQDVLLPEIDATVGEIETRLEELEQEDAIVMRQRRDAR